MSIEIITPQFQILKRKYAKIAIDSSLYHHGWMMYNELKKLRDSNLESYVDISVAKDTELDIYVGVSIFYKPRAPDKSIFSSMNRDTRFVERAVCAYVKESHRRKGIGSQLLRSFKYPLGQMISYSGERGSDEFWRKNKTNYKGHM